MKKKSLFIVLLVLIFSFMLYKGVVVDYFEGLDDTTSVEENIDIIDTKEDEIKEEKIAEPRTTNIDILAVGDIMFHMPQIKSADKGQGEYDFNPMFKYVKEYIQDADISLGNYETVTVNDRNYSGFPRFNSPMETILTLKETGFDILSTANNHSLDQGKTGIISTIEAINDNGLRHAGTNLDKSWQPLIVEVEGIRVGVLSYTFGLNGLDSLLSSEELTYMVNLIDEEKIQFDIQRLKDKNVDIIISYIHWGHEYHHEPSEYQLSLGRQMVDWGTNIVFGSHPHVMQKSEIVEVDGKDNLIVYSMGNFLSNQREITMGNSYTEDGVMVKVNIEKDLVLNQTIINEIEYIPTWVYRYNEGGKFYYEILPTEDIINGKLDINLDTATRNRIEKSFNNTMNAYNGNN
ncbi:MAG: CapA family protein [Tissierellaceae bacterium]|nr:CapA family protein [Tissierellaceae bacterium]